jgi:hypothetical protein
MVDGVLLYCTKCKGEKFATDFPVDKRKSSGRRSWCRECSKKACQDYEERRRIARWAAKGVQPPQRRIKPTDTEFAEAVAESGSIREVMGKLGLNPNGGGEYALIKQKIAEMELDISHYLPSRVDDLAGNRFGDWLVLKYVRTNKNHNARWECRCYCWYCTQGDPITREVTATQLTNGRSVGCGRTSRTNYLLGNRYGKLTVSGFVKIVRGRGARWKCQCDCGNTHEVFGNTLEAGTTQSCGCLHYKGGPKPKHGYARKGKTKEYRTWGQINQRCKNPDNKAYPKYGGRGITICWRCDNENPDGFMNFIEDVGESPRSDWSLDRIEPSGIYEPGNVRWAPDIIQDVNKGKYRQLLTEVSKRLGMSLGEFFELFMVVAAEQPAEQVVEVDAEAAQHNIRDDTFTLSENNHLLA